MRRRWGMLPALGVMAAVQWTPAQARAEGVKHPWHLPARSVKVERDRHHRVLLTIRYHDIMTYSVKKKLQSGLPTTIVLAGGVFDARTHKPLPGVAVWQSCKVVYDVWNEVYRMRISTPEGDKKAVALGLGGVTRRCAELRGMPLRGRLRTGQRLFVAATVEVNPISQKMLENIRRWVSRPPGSSPMGPGDSLFGSFVGMFIARIGKADLHVSFRSKVFRVP